MSSRRRISVKLHTLIIAISMSILALWIINENLIDRRRFCDLTVGVSSVANDARLINSLNYVPSSAYKNTKTKTILYWTKSDVMSFGDGNIFASCPVWKCVATKNRSALSIQDFDAILFHAQNVNKSDLPRRRSPHQRYIFHNLETQVFRPIPEDDISKNFFNWTMTYRRDSTLMKPPGVLKLIDADEYIPPQIPAVWKDVSKGMIDDKTHKIVEGKKKLVAWFASDCVTPSKRELYIAALKEHIQIDIYGDCGSLQCDKKDANCFEVVEKEYYFYLAMENSFCIDYVSKDVFNILQYDIVPVVYGAADYPTVLPPGSYIDIGDFADPKQLADFLWGVSQDPEKYLSYLKWKTYLRVEIQPEYYTICEFCKKLHQVNHSPLVVEDIHSWWTEGQCLREPSFKGIPAIHMNFSQVH